MRCLNRQKTTIHYSNYIGNQEIVDENGNYTGEKQINYSNPTEISISLGNRSGDVSFSPFGTETDYDVVAISDDVNCPIKETSIIWIENKTTDKHDYIVKKINKSLNFVSYALKKIR